MPPPGTVGRAALLAPLSGPQNGIGQIVTAAASLGGPTAPGSEVAVVDAGTTVESAVAAARAEVAAGARMLLGPLFSAQCVAVAEAVGRGTPVVGLTNDDSIAGGNLFVFGLTPAQSAGAILTFAASRGMRSVVTVVPPGEFGSRHIAAAQAAAAGAGMAMGPPVVTADPSGIVNRVREAAGGALPAAVYLPVVSAPFEGFAGALGDSDVQILGSEQWSTIQPQRVGGLQGAWFAAPDPISFEGFAIALEEQAGAEAGIVAGLAFDAVEMARLLGRLGQQDRDGLLREGGFDGILGPYRFLPSGRCARGLGVLSVEAGATTLIGEAGA